MSIIDMLVNDMFFACPSCHAKQLAQRGLRIEDTLLADVPHRQVVATLSWAPGPFKLSFCLSAFIGFTSNVLLAVGLTLSMKPFRS